MKLLLILPVGKKTKLSQWTQTEWFIPMLCIILYLWEASRSLGQNSSLEITKKKESESSKTVQSQIWPYRCILSIWFPDVLIMDSPKSGTFSKQKKAESISVRNHHIKIKCSSLKKAKLYWLIMTETVQLVILINDLQAQPPSEVTWGSVYSMFHRLWILTYSSEVETNLWY